MRSLLLLSAVGFVSSCAHLGPAAAAPEELGRIYDGSETQLKARVARWFESQGLTLEPWARDPHVLVSRVKETNVGVVKGEARDPLAVSGPASAPGGEGTAPLSIDADEEQVRTANLEETSRAGARDFHTTLANAYANTKVFDGTVSYDKWGQDRAAYVDRDWWEVRFHALSPKRTQVLILRNHASDWGSSADKSFNIGASVYGHPASNAAPAGYLDRDLQKEQALAEHLDFSAGVELVGLEAPTHTEAPLVPSTDDTPVELPPAASCNVDLASVELAAGQVLLLADPEGTSEAQASLRQVLCAALAKGLPVTVALSISAYEQARLNAWITSPGTAKDRAALLAGSFWNRPWQDGRSSAAMLELLEALRAEASRGQNVSVLAGDVDLRGNARTVFISGRLLQHVHEHPERLVIGLFSNTLVSKKAGSSWDPEALPLGYRLASAGLRVQSFDVSYLIGTQWNCRLFRAGAIRCGTWPLVPGPGQRMFGARRGLNPFEKPSKEGFDGLWYVGRVNASPPALGIKPFKDQGDQRGGVLAPPVDPNDKQPSLF
jgi:hypothetical protein